MVRPTRPVVAVSGRESTEAPTLAAWLRPLVEARKATAEAAAARSTADWHRTGGYDNAVYDGNGDVVVYDEGTPTEEEADHIAFNDPRQIIADCEYHLAELKEHDRTHRCDWGDYHSPDRPCTPLKRLARIYRHRDPEGYADLTEDWEP